MKIDTAVFTIRDLITGFGILKKISNHREFVEMFQGDYTKLYE